MATRRERIEEMLRSEPHDPFLRFGLAMEQVKAGEIDEALQGFDSLMHDSPPYIPAFLMAAQQLVSRDEIERARAILREGIESARRAGDGHAAAEMADLLANLGALGE